MGLRVFLNEPIEHVDPNFEKYAPRSLVVVMPLMADAVAMVLVFFS